MILPAVTLNSQTVGYDFKNNHIKGSAVLLNEENKKVKMIILKRILSDYVTHSLWENGKIQMKDK